MSRSTHRTFLNTKKYDAVPFVCHFKTEFETTGTLAETDTAGWELRYSADSELALTGRGAGLH